MRVAAFKFECNAPGAVYMNGVAPGTKSPKSMKVKTWKIHVLRRFRDIEHVKSDQNPFMEATVDLAPSAGPERSQFLVQKRSDHGSQYVNS